MRILKIIISVLLFIKKKRKKIPYSAIINLTSHVDKHSVIGKCCYIGKNVYITKSIIGNYTSIANNVSIGQGEHKVDAVSTSSMFYDNEFEDLTQNDCIIGNDVWLGTGVTVLRGVRIGDGAIIGANAVVTKNIPDYCIAVGVPAKVIKRRLLVNVTEKIKETKWWNDEYEVAKDKIICLTNELKL